MEDEKNSRGKGFMMALLDGIFGSVERIIGGVIDSVTQTTADVIRRGARTLLALFLALVGIIFFLSGSSQFLSTLWQVPGLGEMVVGGVVFVVALISYAVIRDEK